MRDSIFTTLKEKIMANKKNVLEMLVIVFVFGITVVGFIGCSADGGGGGGSGGGGGLPMGRSIDWTTVPIDFVDSVDSIAYGNGKFVMVGSLLKEGTPPMTSRTHKIAYSTNGTSWEAEEEETELFGIFGRIHYCGDKFFTEGSGSYKAYSLDGISWTPVTTTTFDDAHINSIAYGGGKFVAGCTTYSPESFTTSTKMAYSTDGTSWTTVTPSVFSSASSMSTNFINVAYGSDKFVAVGGADKMAYSSNGINWTDVSFSTFNRIPRGTIAYGNGKFVAEAVDNDKDLKMVYSSDGINWIAKPSSPFTGGISDIIYCDDKFFAIGYDGEIAYSSDGVSWLATTRPFPDYFELTYGGGKFIAIGYESASATKKMAFGTFK
jgi:hypothetical protein